MVLSLHMLMPQGRTLPTEERSTTLQNTDAGSLQFSHSSLAVCVYTRDGIMLLPCISSSTCIYNLSH